jgi:PAS domain S-box-containing protein
LEQDITKLIEKAVEQSEERYRAIVENRTEMICCFLPDGTLTFVNEAYCRYFKKNRVELIGHKFMPLIPESDREKVFKSISFLNPDNPIFTHEHRVFAPNGDLCWHKWTNRAIFDDQNNLMEYQAVGWDITERKQAEEALKKAHDELEQRVKERTKELEIQKSGLEELNTAMKVLLKKRQEDKIEIEDNVLTNVKELIEPYLEKINKTNLDDQQRMLLSILESNLNEITSPFSRRMSQKYLNLTPTEIKIANLIRRGISTKKIAELLNKSPMTVSTQRRNIRRKVGLQKKRANLRSYLLSIH